MYTCIIVDDHEHAIDLIKNFVSQVPLLSIILATTKSIEALTFLDTCKPDIIFLDIQMPEIDGIEFIGNIKAKWGNNMPKVVFTTGHPQYALEGYAHGVVDYLLKPITINRFKQCIDRIFHELNKNNTLTEQPEFLFADGKGKRIKINFNDIIYVESAGNYITIVTEETKSTVYKSMNAMQELLPCNNFLRVHKSHLVAIDKVYGIRGNEIIVKVGNTEEYIPIGSKFREGVAKQLRIS